MKKVPKNIFTFIVSSIITYLIVGYVANAVLARAHWVEGVTVWDKLREYYIRTAPFNIAPTLIIALLYTIIVIIIRETRH